MSKSKNNDVIKAWKLWSQVYLGVKYSHIQSLIVFAKFTGDPYDHERANYINIHNPEVMRKINLINGPNGLALLKMWKAQDA